MSKEMCIQFKKIVNKKNALSPSLEAIHGLNFLNDAEKFVWKFVTQTHIYFLIQEYIPFVIDTFNVSTQNIRKNNCIWLVLNCVNLNLQ